MRTPPSLLCACLVVLGCSKEPTAGLSWAFVFDDPAVAGEVQRVEVSIRERNCAGAESYAGSVTRDGPAPTPPELPAGQYALVGHALGRNCTLLAYGCVQTRLPAREGEVVEVVLDAVEPRPTCEGSCQARCAAAPGTHDAGPNPAPDAGPSPSDAGPDASADAGMDAAIPQRDAGQDAAAGDSGPPDAAQPDASRACDGEVGPGGHCYRFEDLLATWAEAEDACVAWGGHLVSFNGPDEELWVSERAATSLSGDPVRHWIGFSDSETEGTWVWTDGSGSSQVTFDLSDPAADRFKTTDIPYTHWGADPPTKGNREPNNGDPDNPFDVPGEDCGQSLHDRVSGPGGITPRPEWDDQRCTKTKPWVCERS